MKLIEKLAKDFVLNEIDPSDYVERAPDQVAMECFQAGFRAAREMAAQCIEEHTQHGGLYVPEFVPSRLRGLGEGDA